MQIERNQPHFQLLKEKQTLNGKNRALKMEKKKNEERISQIEKRAK